MFGRHRIAKKEEGVSRSTALQNSDGRNSDGRDPGGRVSEGAADLRSEPGSEQVEAVEKSIAVVFGYLHDDPVPASLLVNPLLDVWEVVQKVDGAVGRPVEALLPTLLQRSLVRAEEIVPVLEETRALLLQAELFAHS